MVSQKIANLSYFMSSLGSSPSGFAKWIIDIKSIFIYNSQNMLLWWNGIHGKLKPYFLWVQIPSAVPKYI